jgi:arsenate reductase (thioredoxin)
MKYVLFVCTHNAGRSQMGQAFFEQSAPGDVRAESAGQEPGERIWPNVVEAMAERGIDIRGRRPKRLDLEMQLHADWAITLGCGGACPYVPTMVEDWQIPDPAGLSLAETRPIRGSSVRRGSPRRGDPRVRRPDAAAVRRRPGPLVRAHARTSQRGTVPARGRLRAGALTISGAARLYSGASDR